MYSCCSRSVEHDMVMVVLMELMLCKSIISVSTLLSTGASDWPAFVRVLSEYAE